MRSKKKLLAGLSVLAIGVLVLVSWQLGYRTGRAEALAVNRGLPPPPPPTPPASPEIVQTPTAPELQPRPVRVSPGASGETKKELRVRLTEQEAQTCEERVSFFTEQAKVFQKGRSEFIGNVPNPYGSTTYFYIKKMEPDEVAMIEFQSKQAQGNLPEGQLKLAVQQKIEAEARRYLEENAVSRLFEMIVPSDTTKSAYVQALRVDDRSTIRVENGAVHVPASKSTRGGGAVSTEQFNRRYGHLMQLSEDEDKGRQTVVPPAAGVK